jgi:hypothetical protein
MVNESGLVRSGGRDLRIDFVRGLALWFILIDHAGNNPLQHLTLGRFALCDAAEVFVLLSGISSGLAYGSLYERNGWGTAAKAALRRACVIYGAYLGVFLLFGALVWAADAVTGSDGALVRTMRLATLAEHPILAPAQVFLMRFMPYTMDVLPLYVALLGALAAILPLLKRPAFLLGISAVVYALGRRYDLNIPTWDGGGWGFDPLEWQALFLIGVVLGDRARPGRATWRVPGWVVVASAGFLLATRSIQLLQTKPELAAALPLFGSVAHALEPFFPVPDVKVGLHPLRLLSVLSLAVMFRALVSHHARWLGSRFASPFVLMGQHSLTVFCAGVPLSFLTMVVLERFNGVVALVAVNVVGLAVSMGVAVVATQVNRRKRTRSSVGVLNAAV